MIQRCWPFRRRCCLTPVREIHYAMGTLLDMTLYHPEPDVGRGILRQACREARRLEAILSRYSPSSELSRLNARAGQGHCPVSPELFHILAAARAWARWSQGAFDPTVGAVLTLWRKAADGSDPPAEAQVQAALQAGGWTKLRLLPPRQVALTAAGMSVDLGGIGKGYAVDQMGSLLRRHGVRHALIDFGQSSLLAIGTMPDGRAWPIRVRCLDGTVGTESLAIQDQAVGTSSSFSQSFTPAGKTLSHVVDPRCGRPLDRPGAVTVVAPTATAAEALSTALLVLTAAAEPTPCLPRGVSALRMRAHDGLVPLGRTAGHA